jgi:hypothetical protein
MKVYEIEVTQAAHLRISIEARDEKAAIRGAELYVSHRSGHAVVVERVEVLREHVEAHGTRAQSPADANG